MTLGDHIRKRRLDLGLTQRQVAAQIGADVTSVRNWEGNATSPALWFMPGIIRFLGYTPNTPAKTLGERLRACRRERGISQEKLADLLEVDEGTVRRWERGRSRPKKLHLSALQGLETG
jgi:transcriptional regulator with XRE-family HTH domain